MYLFWTIFKIYIYILFVFTTGYCGCEMTGNGGTFPVHVLCAKDSDLTGPVARTLGSPQQCPGSPADLWFFSE